MFFIANVLKDKDFRVAIQPTYNRCHRPIGGDISVAERGCEEGNEAVYGPKNADGAVVSGWGTLLCFLLIAEMLSKERRMISYTGVNHLAFATGDMDTTIRFWRDLLGMRLVAAMGSPGYRHYFFEISKQDMVAFFEWPDVTPGQDKDHGAPVIGPHTFDHVSIGVATDDDLWEIKDMLDAAGIWVSEVVDHGFIHSVYSFDPNNIPIEFSAPVAGLDIRKEPVMVDSEPTSEARKGVDPVPCVWPAVTSPVPLESRVVYEGMGSELAEGIKKSGAENGE